MNKIKPIISIIAIFCISYIFGAILVEHDMKDIKLWSILLLTGLGFFTICLIILVIDSLYNVINEYFEDKNKSNE